MVETKKILIVDDDKQIRDLLSDYLTKKGFMVSTAKDGLEAISKSEAEKFDYIFLDIKMSGLNGVEVFKHIKQNKPQTNIIIMTGFRIMAEELMSDELKKQIHTILYKPFSMKCVLKCVGSKCE
ncbi:MAG: response regulator [Candidatus Omnitrophota bacterium]